MTPLFKKVPYTQKKIFGKFCGNCISLLNGNIGIHYGCSCDGNN